MILISALLFSPQAMTDKTANYKSRLQKAENNKKSQIKILKKTHESQLAMKAELIHNLEELIEEQETKIAELESHIKGSSPSQSLNAANTKSSSIRKLVDSINDLHTEKSRIHETWLSTQSELETVKHEHKETVNNLSDSISELESKLRKSQAEIIKLQNEGTGSVSFFVKLTTYYTKFTCKKISDDFNFGQIKCPKMKSSEIFSLQNIYSTV